MVFVRIAITFIGLLVFAVLLYPKMAAALLLIALAFLIPKKSRQYLKDLKNKGRSNK